MKNKNTNKNPSDSENREYKPKCIYCNSNKQKNGDLDKQKTEVKFRDIFVMNVKRLLLLMTDSLECVTILIK